MFLFWGLNMLNLINNDKTKNIFGFINSFFFSLLLIDIEFNYLFILFFFILKLLGFGIIIKLKNVLQI